MATHLVLLRRRLLLLTAGLVLVFAYLSFVHLVHEAVLTASRAASSPAASAASAAAARANLDAASSVGQQRRQHHQHQLPTVTGYSLEMQFRSAPRFACASELTPPTEREVVYHNVHWQKEAKLFLYSAHLDRRLKAGGRTYPFVRVLAMAEGSLDNDTFFCQLWRQDGPPIVTSAAATEIWVDSWDQRSRQRSYRPYLLSCLVIDDDHHNDHRDHDRNNDGGGDRTNKNSPAAVVPFAVSVVSRPCERKASSFLPLNGADSYDDGSIVGPPSSSSSGSGNKRGDFAVCVKGMDFADDISARLVEWVEMNRLLGAQLFTFYLYRVHPNTRRVLDYYANVAGVAQVVPLTLPGMQPNFPPSERTKFLRRNVWQKRRNELVPYNDCFYRHAARFRFVVPLDVDELIVPLQHDNWTQLIDYLSWVDPEFIPSHASLSAQQVYFFESNQPKAAKATTTTGDRQQHQLLPMVSQTVRAANYSKPGHGVKSFVVSDNCLTVFNHYALEALHPGVKRDAILPTRWVQLNHYKTSCPPVVVQQECSLYTSRTRTDRRLAVYEDRLAARVEHVLRELNLVTS